MVCIDSTKVKKIIEYLIYTTLLWMIIGLFIIFTTPNYTIEEYYRFKLIAINDSSKIEGKGSRRGFLIEQSNIIKFIIDNGNGGRKIFEAPTNKSTIYETDKEPELVVYIKQPDYDNSLFIYSLFKDLIDYNYQYTTPYRYDFYIPKDSITNSFTVDLED